jgi:hypothetical protein
VPIGVLETARVKIEIHSAGKTRQKRSETDHEPFPDVEWLEENFLRQFEGFAKRRKNLDLSFGLGHHRISKLFAGEIKRLEAISQMALSF